MEPLRGVIRDYPWGSRTIIAELQGRPTPTDGPEAELWLGAHPASPSTVWRGDVPVALPEVLAEQPGRWLGEEVVGRFGPRMPFLLKVLAPEQPLSLQAHPDAEQARRGYAAEQAILVGSIEEAGRTEGDASTEGADWSERDGPARRPGSRPRNYVDPYHKPELLVAMERFDALCGFQDPEFSVEVFESFRVPALAPVVAALRRGVAGLHDAVRTLLTWPAGQRRELLDAVRTARVPARFAGAAGLVCQLSDRYPDDPGVLVALLLNRVTLNEGEAVWMPAGNLHAYLRGTGVEILAASDNVLRGGLTGKHVDVPELLRVLRFEVLAEPVMKPVPVGPGVVTWPVPVDDFALHRVRVGDEVPRVSLTLTGPRVVLGFRGEVTVADAAGGASVRPGRAAVGPADGGPLSFTGAGEVFVGSVGKSGISGMA